MFNVTALKDYWRVIIAGVFVLAGGIIIQVSNSQIDQLSQEELSLLDEIESLEGALALAPITEDSMSDEVVVIEQSSQHAREMGAEMIAIQQTLSTFYKSAEPLDPKEDLTDVRKAEDAYVRLTNQTDYGNTWQLNKDWTMTLDTVANYSGTKTVPVVFTMKTKDGKVAGIVRGVYNPEIDLLESIIVDYTVDGRMDATDVGGH